MERPSQRPTRPAPPCAIAPRPDDAMVCSLLDDLAHQTARLVRRYGGSPAAERCAADVARALRATAHALGLPDAAFVAADMLPTRAPAPLGDRLVLALDGEQLTVGDSPERLRDLARILRASGSTRGALLADELAEGLQEYEGDSEGAAGESEVRHGA